MKRTVTTLVCALMLTAPAAVSADEIFSDRAAFLAAVEGPVVVDFEGEAAGPVVGDPWLALGVLFDDAEAGDGMAIGIVNGDERILYAAAGEERDIDIVFRPEAAGAFGIEVYSNDVHDPSERIVIYGLEQTVLADLEMPVTESSTTSAFLGYVPDEPIWRVAFVEAEDDDYAGIGEVVFTLSGVKPVRRETWSSLKQRF
jgi:hypothetical protein